MNIIKSSLELISLIDDLHHFQVKDKVCIPEKTLLLTGATGFLGIHLLSELVHANIYKHIYVIVRNIKKINEQITYYKLADFSFSNITIIEGDLKNLSIKDFPMVSDVIHSAAIIHCVKNLAQLWHDNVEVTHKICQIYKKQAQVYFISTLSVFVSSNLKGIHYPNSLPISEDYSIYGGYAQSKYISEKIVENFGGKIIRLGLLTGSTFSGIFPTNDFFTQTIVSLFSIGSTPTNYEEAFVDMTPVDLCVQQIIFFLSSKQKIIHIANKEALPLSSIVDALQLNSVDNQIFEMALSKQPSLVNTLLHFAFFKTIMLKTNFHFYNIDLFQSTGHGYNIDKAFTISNKNLLELYISNILKSIVNANVTERIL